MRFRHPPPDTTRQRLIREEYTSIAAVVWAGVFLALAVWGSRLAAVALVAGWVFVMLIGGGLFESYTKRARARRRRPRNKT